MCVCNLKDTIFQKCRICVTKVSDKLLECLLLIVLPEHGKLDKGHVYLTHISSVDMGITMGKTYKFVCMVEH